MRFFVPLLIVLISCQAKIPQTKFDENVTVIHNVNVIDLSDGSIREGRSVVVAEGKIQSVIERGNDYGGAVIIEGSGKFLIPGLTEMHAHIPSPQWGRDNTEETLFLYLSNGVTTIRGMLGHPVHLKLREQALNNELLSPRIFSSSPSVNGNSVKTVEEAIEKVTQFKEDGYDFLKIHPGLTKEVFDQVVKTANEVGIGFSGHVPIDVGVRHAIASGYGSIDHVDGFIEGLVPESAAVDPLQNGFFGYNFTDLADESLMDELVAMTNEKRVWIVPTQSLFDRWFSPVDAGILVQESEMKYMPKSTREQWVKSKNGLTEDPSYDPEKWQRFNHIRKSLMLKLQESGHGLLLGSDAPQVFNVPGFSIHHELRGMTDAGISSLEALQSGTINAAKFFNMEGKFGLIEAGASADVVLLDENPLENIINLQNPRGVMVRGVYLDRAAIDGRLKEIEDRAKNI